MDTSILWQKRAEKMEKQRDILAVALRQLIEVEQEYGDAENVAVNQALEIARNALAKSAA